MATAFLFPGQGSQSIGMGQDLAQRYEAARHVFEQVDEALGQKLSTLMWQGTAEELTLTTNAQPALFAVSLAVMAVLRSEYGITPANSAKFVAGHSLGEYSALAAVGAFSLQDGARLLRIRGDAMQAATPLGVGAMAAILGMEFPQVVEIASLAALAAEGEVCQAANDNSSGQVVISGHKAAVERACVIAKEKGAKRAILLPVSAPFHCALMQPAADVMAEALANTVIHKPTVPIVANVRAEAISEVEDIRQALIAQVTGTVRLRESIDWMWAQDVTLFCEAGAGKVLTGLMKKNAAQAKAIAIEAPADIEAAQSFLQQEQI